MVRAAITQLSLAVLALGLLSPRAHAVTCSVSGTITIESLDGYYCDPAHLDCTDWKETNLDSGSRPMKYMLLTLTSSAGSLLGWAVTDSTGAYSISWSQAACYGNVYLTAGLIRVHEDDVADSLFDMRFRFFVVEPGTLEPWALELGDEGGIVLDGGPASYSYTFPRTTGTPSLYVRLANVYYTVQSAVREIKGWHTEIDDAFGDDPDATVHQIIHSDTYVPVDGTHYERGTRSVHLDKDAYNKGGTIRHELGHGVHHALHHFEHNRTCAGKDFGGVGGHQEESCEWDFGATTEGIATFFGVRSITSSDKDAWRCNCRKNGNQDICSETHAAALADPDGITTCALTSSHFYGLGDDFASSREDCVRVRADKGCRVCNDVACSSPWTCPNGGGVCSDYQLWGHRNEVNVARFFWDVIDENDETGSETTHRSIAEFAGDLNAMDCASGSSGYGVEHNCDEPNRVDEAQCIPFAESGTWASYWGISLPPERVEPAPSQGDGTRDSYNAVDISAFVPDSQVSAREVNCLEGAR